MLSFKEARVGWTEERSPTFQLPGPLALAVGLPVVSPTYVLKFLPAHSSELNLIEILPKPESVLPLPVTMTYSTANRLATYNGQAVQFDADGNLLTGPLAGEMANFRFDSRNRLIQAGETTCRYDAENQRIEVNQTSYVVNSQPALSQVLVKEENGVKTFYVYGLGLLGEENEGKYRAYHFDFRGSTVALTDQTGKVLERFQYGPYGELLKGEATVTPFLFNGKYGVMTDDNGLYYMRARFYSPVVKRFVNMDVLLGNVEEGQTLNRYTYVTGRPVSYIDPFGLLEMRDEYGEPTASNDDLTLDVEDIKLLLAISSFFTPGPGEILDIDVLFGITQSSTGWEKLGATSSLVLSVLTLGTLPNYGSVKRCTAGIPLIGHATRWADMTESQRRAFKHSYSRHGKDFGLPNWQEIKAEELRQLFNQAVEQIPDKGTYLGVRRKPHNGVSVEAHLRGRYKWNTILLLQNSKWAIY